MAVCCFGGHWKNKSSTKYRGKRSRIFAGFVERFKKTKI